MKDSGVHRDNIENAGDACMLDVDGRRIGRIKREAKLESL